MSDTDTQAPARNAADALSDLESMIQAAADHALPVNIHTALVLLVEHAKLSTHEDVSTVSARVDAVETLLTEAGIKPAAEPTNAPPAI